MCIRDSSVTFHYTRHEDHKTVTECLPVIDFIKRLIIHIPDKHFKMVRYYEMCIRDSLDTWDNVSFDDKRRVVDLMITTVAATSDSLNITWKI